MLCVRCRNFDIQSFARATYPFRGYLVSDVCQSAQDGCSFCSLLVHHGRIRAPFRGFLPFLDSPEWIHFSVVREASDIMCDEDDGLNISLILVHLGSERRLTLHVAADECTPARTRRDITGSIITTKYLTESDIKLATAWLRDCDLNHTACRSTLSGTQDINLANTALPSRCIEIREPGVTNCSMGSSPTGMIQSESWDWQLSVTAGKTGKYIVLSHRWNGAAKACQTTKSNYSDRLKGTRHESTNMGLSRLFMDICRLAYRFHVRYVWIDTICIIQDDPDDWKQESAKMADYYQKAWLNLSATVTTADGGLVDSTQAEYLSRVSRLPYRNKSGVQEGYFYVQCNNQDVSKIYKSDITNSELLRRGWVYQEWSLSRRVMTFSNFGVFLQCQSSDPQSIVGDAVNMERPGMSSWTQMKIGIAPTITGIISDWQQRTIREISTLYLTKFAQDRLVAIAGVAREFTYAIDSYTDGDPEYHSHNALALVRKYVCGHFPHRGLRHLLWECAQPGQTIRVDGIPTWSWASIASSEINDRGEEVLIGSEITYVAPDRSGAQLLCDMFEAITIPVDPSVWQPDFLHPDVGVPDDEYGNDNRFVVLGISGVIQPVQINDVFTCDADAVKARRKTIYDGETKKTWRRVSAPSRPDIIAGWASLESPEYQTIDACRATPGGIHSLYIQRRRTKTEWYQYVFDVLYLRPVEKEGFDHCFERIGAGRLFGRDVEKYFRTTEKTKIHLV
ncbi:heterokaryon incompatibility protein-domain-containing protein [Xylaria curta]|nr:heterokaryon incompatibility protein-domain-containing protein [Xylaria curta]